MKISIIVPVFNEEKTIIQILKNIKKIESKVQGDFEIIVINDGSTDNTINLLNENKNIYEKLININKNQGKGNAINEGFRNSTGDIIIIQDADLEYNPKDVLKLIKPIVNSSYKVVYGSRILGKKYFENLENFSHWIRILGNIFLTFFSNIINNQNLTDAHTCYKVFDSKTFKSIKLRENNFNFCPEITTKISNKKIEIYELPISYNGREYKDGKKIKFTDGLKAMTCIIKYKFFM